MTNVFPHISFPPTRLFILTLIVLHLITCILTPIHGVNSHIIDTDAHNNWAVLICASRFWFNYRHIANTLSLYRTVKRLGIPDSQILLMLADDVACNPRNSFPAKVINNADARLDLYGDTVEVDYRGYEVTAETVIRLLTDRLPPHVPRSKRLLTDEESRILVFMTGHGGDEFLKFQDSEELSAHDMADAVAQMHEGKRYKELLFLVDTCQANTMYNHFRSPGVIAAGSSAKGENSYSHHMDMDLGVAVIDRFTYWMLDYVEKLDRRTATNATLANMFSSLSYSKMLSSVGTRTDLFNRSYYDATIADFFSGSRPIKLDEDQDQDHDMDLYEVIDWNLSTIKNNDSNAGHTLIQYTGVEQESSVHDVPEGDSSRAVTPVLAIISMIGIILAISIA